MKNPPLYTAVAAAIMLFCGCERVPIKQYYLLNYITSPPGGRALQERFPVTVRLRNLDIEDAYARSQIVYRRSPYELRYYVYKLWAVKPDRMITDLIYKHLVSANLVRNVIRRYDEGPAPDYELSGSVEAIEEYDSDRLWFAHLGLRLTLTRLSDGRVIYSRVFDNRKKVFQYLPEAVVQEMSTILEYDMNQMVADLGEIFAKETGSPAVKAGEKEKPISGAQ